MVTIDSALDDIMRLDYASREILLQILQKRQVEARRDEIAKAARKSLKDYHSGETPASTTTEVVEKLNLL